MYQKTVTSVPQDVVGQVSDNHPYYPHSPKRTLVALTSLGLFSTIQEKRDFRKQFESFEPYVYESFDDALEAALPGDAIVLAKGSHTALLLVPFRRVFRLLAWKRVPPLMLR